MSLIIVNKNHRNKINSRSFVNTKNIETIGLKFFMLDLNLIFKIN